MQDNKKTTIPILPILLIIGLCIPLIFGRNQYYMILVTTVVLYGVLTSAWNIIGGMGGGN